MVAVLGPEANAGAVIEPEAAPLRLPGRHLEALAPLDPLNPLSVYQLSPIQRAGKGVSGIAELR